jgi:tetratricopeptide (TPR) repeat protein
MNIEDDSARSFSKNSPQKNVSSVFINADEIRSFSHATQVRIALAIMPLSLLLIVSCLPFNMREMPVEGVIVLSVFFIGLLTLCIWFFLKAIKPAIILSSRGMSYNPLGKKIFLEWEHIDGLVEDKASIRAGKYDEKIKIVYNAGDSSIRELIISAKLFTKGSELFSLLKKIIPQKSSKELEDRLSQLKPLSTVTMKYKNMELSTQGIMVPSNNNMIAWNNIVSLKTAGYVIAGYGQIIVEYTSGSSKQILQIQSSTNEFYKECIRFLLAYAKNAAVDPGLIKILNYPVEAAKADFMAVFLICSGIILTFAGLLILSFYAPTIPSTWIYPLLIIPFSLFPLIWTIKLLAGRFSGASRNPSAKIYAALFFNIGTLCSVAILFAFSPASITWLLADACAITDRFNNAENYYKRAESELSGNSDFLFSVGQFYFKKKDWNAAARYYILAYEKDPTNWMAGPLEKIPRSLLLAGRGQEAIEWCNKILKSYSERKDVTRVIAKLKEAIYNKDSEQKR